MDLDWAIQALQQYGLLGIFFVIALEYSCLPMPSEVVLPLSGMIAAASRLPLVLVVAVSVLAGLLGSSVCYVLGAWGGRPFLERMLRRFPKAMKALDQTKVWQSEVGGLSVMIARVIPLFRTWVSFVAGITRQSFGGFLLYSMMGIIIWNTLLLASGYYLYQSGIVLQLDHPWILPLAGFCIAAIAFALRHVFSKRQPTSQ